MTDFKNNEVKYAQQHLANERTYLAWIRTGIAVVGVGFLTTSLHFTLRKNQTSLENHLAIILGLLACLVGFSITILSTYNYRKKRDQIKQGIFVPSNHLVMVTSLLVSFSIALVIVYFLFLI